MTTRDLWQLLATLLAIAAGASVAAQARMNAELTNTWGSPLVAATWSTGTGLILVLVALAFSPAARRGVNRLRHAIRERHVRPVETIGGIFGGALVGTQSAAVPLIGVALFTMCVVGGNVAASVVIDRTGLSPSGRTPITVRRVTAAALAIAGVAVASSTTTTLTWPVILVLAASLVVGMLVAVQAALNGRLNAASGHVVAASLVNFLWAMAAFIVVGGLQLVTRGMNHTMTSPPWWALGGGLCGLFFVSATAWAVRHIGVMVYVVATTASQLCTATLLDAFSPTAPTQTLSVWTATGIALTCTATVLAAASNRGRASDQSLAQGR